MMPATAAVTVPAAAANAAKTWRKAITGIDKRQPQGHALIGPWMTASRRYRLPVGVLIVGYDREPDRHVVAAWVVQVDGVLVEVQTITRTGVMWAGPATIKTLAALADEHPWPPMGKCLPVVVRPDKRNLYAGPCVDCGRHLAVGDGILIQTLGTAVTRGKWIVRCEEPCQPGRLA